MRLMPGDFKCLESERMPRQPISDRLQSVGLADGIMTALKAASLLPEGSVRRIEAVRGTKVRCITGTLWVTLAGDAGDYILQPGDTFTAAKAGLVLAQALKTAMVHVSDHVD